LETAPGLWRARIAKTSSLASSSRDSIVLPLIQILVIDKVQEAIFSLEALPSKLKRKTRKLWVSKNLKDSLKNL